MLPRSRVHEWTCWGRGDSLWHLTGVSEEFGNLLWFGVGWRSWAVKIDYIST